MSDKRLRVTERLAELNARIIASVDDAIHVIDLQERIIASTPHGAEIRLPDGTTASIGRAWLDIGKGWTAPRLSGRFEEARAGRVGVFTGRAQREERTAWFDVIVTGVVAEGGISEVLAISADITLRHRGGRGSADSGGPLPAYRRGSAGRILAGHLTEGDDLDIDGYYVPSAETKRFAVRLVRCYRSQHERDTCYHRRRFGSRTQRSSNDYADAEQADTNGRVTYAGPESDLERSLIRRSAKWVTACLRPL